MTILRLPAKAWDAHVHCLDPDTFPFSSSRAYTPQPAKLEDLVQSSFVENMMLVQSSIEDGFMGLIAHLRQCQRDYPLKVVRGTILLDLDADENALQTSEFDHLHKWGVRSIRIHGSYGGPGHDIEWVRRYILRLSRLYPIQQYGWSISAQLPLSTWSGLKDFIITSPDLVGIKLIADHCGCATPSDLGSLHLANFAEMLQSGKLQVKVSALYRRSPTNIQLMEPVIRLFADNAPQSLLWGSDWPHVDASKKGLQPASPSPGADTSFELLCLHGWLSESEWLAMLVKNPEQLFNN